MPQNYNNRRAHPHRSLTDPYNSSAYPGAGPTLDPITAEAAALVPYNPPYNSSGPPGAESTVNQPSSSSGGLLSNLPSLGEIKGMIDRMGGIDGMLNTLGKVQKVMSGIQQFAPMAKLLMGALPFGAKTSNKSTNSGYSDEYIPRRRRRKKSVTKRRRSTSKSRRPSAKRRRR
ncbi:tyrosine protein kinase [Paenibacillus sp. P96]|uniref:Tyrosine protein kinase n=1 Tax=Paenibacillus zeirhizosphaerae TaxID=2987519 RepID=A0ABT9FMY6_9BACL|nr:tyrosine protein kinase [Paenibacillus sp. P96]MDP4095772.1 tyrosine protein kinase [Paenibacillus sp. P96]